MEYDIFISYKRKSIHMANNLYYRLTMRGYRVFFDLDEMRKDRFDEQIYNYIHNAKDVIVILESGSLDAIYNGSFADDWFCKELTFALKENKNIIPLLLDGYQMPPEKDFPEELKGFAYKNALPFGGLSYFDEYIHQLENKGYITATPIDSSKGKSVFKFFSTEDCQVFESGKQIGEVRGRSDEPFYHFVKRKGRYRFKIINIFTLYELTKTESIDDDSEEIIDIEWPEREIIQPEKNIDIKEPSGDIYPVEIGILRLNMIRVEGGSMRLGATDEQQGMADANEYPPYEAHLKTFYISEFPITQNLFKTVMGYDKSHFKETESVPNDISKELSSDEALVGFAFGGPIGAILGGLADIVMTHKACKHLPVENVSLDDAREFCRRLSKMTNLEFALPTEEEWEYAARGGQKSEGFIFAGSDNIDEVAWYKENGEKKTHPVGLKKPNELGLYDMSGNVWEWTETKGYAYGLQSADAQGDYYVRRGGSWWHEPVNCRVSKRYISDKKKRTSGLGFRVVIRVK